MTIKRYGSEGGIGTGGQRLPFASAVEADGWLYVSGQTPMRDGEVVEGGIVEQARLAFQNCLAIAAEAGYGVADVVHVTAVLTDARYFSSFNKVFEEVFAGHPPARICSVQQLVVDCKVEVDIKCFRADRRATPAGGW
jgi:enamine deaminase RidA (YjgF/YER057c/UK114 family)